MVASLVTGADGTHDAGTAPTVENNVVLVPITDVADYFTGAAWSASMEESRQIISICGSLPTDVPINAP